jgi:hypothetical protein
MTHQQRQLLVDVRPVMKSQLKILTLILTMNAQHVNHAVHAMTVVIAEIVRLVVNNLLTNQQNRSFMSVPMASH